MVARRYAEKPSRRAARRANHSAEIYEREFVRAYGLRLERGWCGRRRDTRGARREESSVAALSEHPYAYYASSSPDGSGLTRPSPCRASRLVGHDALPSTAEYERTESSSGDDGRRVPRSGDGG